MQRSTAQPPPETQDTVPTATSIPTPVRPKGLAEVVLRLFAIVVPALYAMGRFYASSWWQGIGLPSSLERYAFEDYLFLGFYAVLGSVGEYYIGEVGWRLLQAPLVVALCVLFYLTVNGALDWLAREIRLAATRLLAMRRFRWLAPVVRTCDLRRDHIAHPLRADHPALLHSSSARPRRAGRRTRRAPAEGATGAGRGCERISEGARLTGHATSGRCPPRPVHIRVVRGVHERDLPCAAQGIDRPSRSPTDPLDKSDRRASAQAADGAVVQVGGCASRTACA